MNRVIKFRAKELNTNNWVYGYYAMRSEESPVPETNEWYCEHYILVDKGIQGFEEVLIDIKTLGQFTGYFDKNGKEIYEGDQLYICAGYSSVVKFQDGMFVSVYSHPEDGETIPLLDAIGKDTVVIGDVF